MKIGALTPWNHFNCTIQELKQQRVSLPFSTDSFQLHHTGIKTTHSRQGKRISSYFNCTIQELKLLVDVYLVHLAAISIAPYRN